MLGCTGTSSARQKSHATSLGLPKLGHGGFAVNGVYVDNNAVPQHPSAELFESENGKGGRLWIIIDPSRDTKTEQLLTAVRSVHVETQRTFPDGFKVILSETGSSQ